MDDEHPWAGDTPADPAQPDHGQHPEDEEWPELLARTVAHLAAQLTILQIQLRGLATELGEHGAADEPAVMKRLRAIARAEAGHYLRENLGTALTDLIDVDALEADLIGYLTAPADA